MAVAANGVSRGPRSSRSRSSSTMRRRRRPSHPLLLGVLLLLVVVMARMVGAFVALPPARLGGRLGGVRLPARPPLGSTAAISSSPHPHCAAAAAAAAAVAAVSADAAAQQQQEQQPKQRRRRTQEAIGRLVSRWRGGGGGGGEKQQSRAALNWKAFCGAGATRVRRRDLVLGAILAAMATAAAVAVPLGYGGVVNVLLLPTDTPLAVRRQQLVRSLQVLGFIYASEPLLTFVYIRHMTRLASNGVRNLKEAVFGKLLEREIAFFDRKGVGEIGSYLSQDLSGLKDILYGNLQRDRGLRAILEAVLGTALLLRLQPRLGALFSLVIPSVATITARLGRMLTKTVLREGQALAKENGAALEVVRNIREVKSFAAEGKEAARYSARLEATRGLSAEAGRKRGMMESCSRLAIYFSIFTVSALGGRLVQAGQMSADALVSFIGFCFSLNFAIQGINYSWADLQRGGTLLSHVMGVLDAAPTAGAPPAGSKRYVNPGAIRGEVEFKNLHFSYPMRPDVPVLRGINLTLKPGTVTSIVGPSGAGKTTITQILSRFYAPTEGQLLLDGTDIRELDPTLLTKEIALVGQMPNVFAGTVAYNIAYSKGKDTDFSSPEVMAEVRAAARQANALEFIEKFPEGFNTLIGEGGVALSGGQRQRIAIARAILKGSKVLILDEATSALDAESEALVQEALERLMKGRTTLVIAHRLGTVVRSDNIAVVKQGVVVEEGTHAELMGAGAKGFYRQLMATQQTAYLND